MDGVDNYIYTDILVRMVHTIAADYQPDSERQWDYQSGWWTCNRSPLWTLDHVHLNYPEHKRCRTCLDRVKVGGIYVLARARRCVVAYGAKMTGKCARARPGCGRPTYVRHPSKQTAITR
jgi:hypothetical protein